MNILITGGAGYIGSHTALELLNKGYNVHILDNLINSHESTLNKISHFTKTKINFYNIDLREYEKLKSLFSGIDFDAVIHFASLKSISESINNPLLYYNNNVLGSLNLYSAIKKSKCRKIIFSSSASIYESSLLVPFNELSKISFSNPYANTKIINENILEEISKTKDPIKSISLRYFNPAGADTSGIIGEFPKRESTNLFPQILKTLNNDSHFLPVYGNDYDTIDGTGVRDYIHISDLAIAHVKALEMLNENDEIKFVPCNVGTGTGYSVLQILEMFNKILKKKINYKIVKRRKGDVAKCYADIKFSKTFLNWQAKKSLYDMCNDAINWEINNQNIFYE